MYYVQHVSLLLISITFITPGKCVQMKQNRQGKQQNTKSKNINIPRNIIGTTSSTFTHERNKKMYWMSRA